MTRLKRAVGGALSALFVLALLGAPAVASPKAKGGSGATTVTGPHGGRDPGEQIGGRFQKFVTGKSREELYKLGGRPVWPDGLADASVIEAKWTGADANQWSTSIYNPANAGYRDLHKERDILKQATDLLALARGLKKKHGVVYAVSNTQGRAAFDKLFSKHFPKEVRSRLLRVFVVPPVGMP